MTIILEATQSKSNRDACCSYRIEMFEELLQDDSSITSYNLYCQISGSNTTSNKYFQLDDDDSNDQFVSHGAFNYELIDTNYDAFDKERNNIDLFISEINKFPDPVYIGNSCTDGFWSCGNSITCAYIEEFSVAPIYGYRNW